MEEYLQESGSSPNLAMVQSFSSLLTTEQPSQFLTLFSSSPTTISAAGHLQKNHPNSAQTNLHFFDSRLQYNDYDGGFANGDNVLFFEYNNDLPHSEDLVGKLSDRQGEMIRSQKASKLIEKQLFLQMRTCLLVQLVAKVSARLPS